MQLPRFSFWKPAQDVATRLRVAAERRELSMTIPAPMEIGNLRMRTFQNIMVVPSTLSRRFLPNGGPVWPDYDEQTEIRHCRGGVPADSLPKARQRPRETIETPCVWAGIAHEHFGHLVAEFLTRVLASRALRPDDTYLFLADPGKTEADMPGHFWALLEWYGLPRHQVRFVNHPMRVRTLHVLPQTEALHQITPNPQVLDLLDTNARLNELQPRPTQVLYVGRTQIDRGIGGGHAGESYLVQLLQGNGVTVIDPAGMPLRDQLEHYAGAEVICYCEGSAIHGRQLLGRRKQQIVILNRRPRTRIAKAALEARLCSVTYAEVTKCIATTILPVGKAELQLGLAFYDLPVLFRTFRDLGLRLGRVWDDRAYSAAREADAAQWLSGRMAPGRVLDLPKTRAAVAELFRAEGVSTPVP